jgi:signal transduction histidine kinase
MREKWYRSFFKKIKVPHPYFIPFVALICTSALMLMYLVLEEHYNQYTHLKDRLSIEGERIERSISDTIQHTEFVMKMLTAQIKPHHDDIYHIESIIGKYYNNPHLNSVLSWTAFSWFDEKDDKRVDSISGALALKTSHSHRPYIKNAHTEPQKLHFGENGFGFTSQRYILPAAMGVTDNQGKYVGAVTVGFDLNGMSAGIGDKIEDPDISFALLNRDFEALTNLGTREKYSKKGMNLRKLNEIIHDNNIDYNSLKHLTKIDLMSSGDAVYMRKISNYPFVIYLQYDSSSFVKSFRKDIAYRVLEVFVFTLVSFIIIVWIYRREMILRNKAEESKKIAIKALQSKNDFLAYTAHELRSPLSFIVSSSDMMKEKIFGPISAKYLDYINNINSSSKELLLFIEDLLENMKLQKGNFEIKESKVDVKNLILRSVKVNNVNYNDKISIETSFPKTLPFVHSDPKRLLQIFNNIISNAIKYSPKDSNLVVDAKMFKGELFIYFHDKGYGMTEEGLQRSMKEYEIAHDKDAIKAQSVGLGLPLIKSLLELMELKFVIDSKLGEGTDIMVIFPKHKVISKK